MGRNIAGWAPLMLRAIAMDPGPLRRHRELRLLFCAQVVSGFGTFMARVAIPYEVFQLTGSTLAVGALGAVEFVAIVVMALVGGALADAVDRRRMVLATQAASGVVAVALLVDVTTVEWVWPLFAGAGLLAALYGLERPSLDAMIPRLVAREELPATSALWWGGMNLAGIAGPSLAGVLIAVAGVGTAFAIDLATFGVGLVALGAMRAMPAPEEAAAPSLRSIGEGLRFARSRPELIGTYVVDINAMFFGMPTALFPAFAQKLGGPGVLGLLYAAPSMGAVAASVTSGWAGRVHRHGRAIVLAAAAWGVFIALAGFARTAWLAVVLIALAGAMDMISGLFRSTIWNSTIPDHLRGRLAGIEMISYTSGPLLGQVESGAVASFAGVRGSFVSGGLLCVAGCLVAAVALPRFWAYDDRGRSP
jgi:MFS family permease